MGLKINWSHRGRVREGVYVRVVLPEVQADKTNMRCMVHFFEDVEGNPIHAETHFLPFDLNGDNLFKQAYVALKALPAFADAMDA